MNTLEVWKIQETAVAVNTHTHTHTHTHKHTHTKTYKHTRLRHGCSGYAQAQWWRRHVVVDLKNWQQHDWFSLELNYACVFVCVCLPVKSTGSLLWTVSLNILSDCRPVLCCPMNTCTTGPRESGGCGRDRSGWQKLPVTAPHPPRPLEHTLKKAATKGKATL